MSTALLVDLPGTGRIFKADNLFQYVRPFIDAYGKDTFTGNGYYDPCDCHWKYKTLHKYDEIIVKRFNKYLTRTIGQFYVKMLLEIEKRSCCYEDIWTALLKPRGKPYGNNIASFNGLRDNNLIELDYKGKYGRKFYKLTTLGKLVLDAAKKNHVVYKVLRHFMKFEGDFEAHVVQVSFNPETMEDLDPKTFVNMIDAILNDNSDLHKLGTYAYWCQKLLTCLKSSSNFFDMFMCDEVKAWFEEHKEEYNVKNFKKVLDKIAKKYARKAA